MTNKRSARTRFCSSSPADTIAARRTPATARRARLDVTQATLSRDLRDLGVVRVADGGRRPLRAARDGRATRLSLSLDSLLPQLFSRIDGVGELIVLHTLPSGAQPIAEAIDSEGGRKCIGTMAGENTDPHRAAARPRPARR